jgi:ABC-type amino acid transport substrate-binding protein
MNRPSRIIFYLLLSILSGISHAGARLPEFPGEIVLGTNVTSAYAADYAARIQGGSIEHIECIFNRLPYSQRTVPMPWRRAHQEVRKHTIDGFFTTVLLDEADIHGILSEPLVLENWYWFWRVDTPEPASWQKNYRLGVILGSPQALWLKQQDYSAPMTANNLPQLLKLLVSKRIDVILADKEHFERAAAGLNIDNDSYRFRFYRYMPLGVYFSRHFLKAQPDFLKQFNRHIYLCAPEGFQVSEYEREKIKEIMLPWMRKWMLSSAVIQAVVQQNNNNAAIPIADLLREDDLWQMEFQSNTADFSVDVLGNSLSQKLRNFKLQTQSMVTEIIVTDARGFNVGISDMTSDYWQGDEAKYLQIFNRPADTLFFDAVLYDESTRRFQVQLSLQLYQKGNPQAMGVMTVGVNIEKALSLAQ